MLHNGVLYIYTYEYIHTYIEVSQNSCVFPGIHESAHVGRVGQFTNTPTQTNKVDRYFDS